MISSDKVHQNCLAFDRIKPEAVVQNKDGGIQLLLSNSLQIIQIMKIQVQVDQKPAVDQRQLRNQNRNLRQNNRLKRKMCLKQNLNPPRKKQVKSRTNLKSLQAPEVKPMRNRK